MKIYALFVAGAFALSMSALPALGAPLTPVYTESGSFATPGTTVKFQVDEKTQVPGKTLKGGSYSITVVDHLSDRMILRIVGDNGKEQALFLAVPSNGRIPKQLSAGPIAVKLGAKNPALRGFAFPNGAVAEFVYPKAEAVALAKSNSTSVPAIDPASEGRPKASSLSSDDLQMVTLWMLTPTIVGSGKPGIAAARLQQVAEVSPPPPPVAPRPAVRQPVVTAPEPVAPPQMAEAIPVAPKPRKVAHPIKTLPHTASNLPLWVLSGVFSLLFASFLTVRRRLLGTN